ncbi:MAG: helix-turn-helix domain-containing protein [Candidatus Sericytochromatia bacterium]
MMSRPIVRRKWKPEVEDALHELYGRFTADVVAKVLTDRFGKPFTKNAVHKHASKLGLLAGEAQGYMSLAEAARQLGINKQTIRFFFASRGLKARKGSVAWQLTEAQWDMLVARYGARERGVTTTVAAERLGVSRNVVHNWIVAGIVAVERFGYHYRIPEAEIERLRRERMAKQTGCLGTASAAGQIGMSMKGLQRAIKAGAVQALRHGRAYRIPKREIARLVAERRRDRKEVSA